MNANKARDLTTQNLSKLLLQEIDLAYVAIQSASAKGSYETEVKVTHNNRHALAKHFEELGYTAYTYDSTVRLYW